jgi:SDR family mycofactocin-dependent oxidoreductase
MDSPDTRGRFAEKVVFITGAGRGQGRQFAVDFANEGADIIGIDICHDIETASVPMSTVEDLEQTNALVEQAGRRMVARPADVRSLSEVEAAVAAGVTEFGRIDVIVAAAGIVVDVGPFWTLSEQGWRDVLDTNLTGVWHSVKAAVPTMIEAGRGGAVIMVASAGATKGFPNITNYVAAKQGVVGMMKPMAVELGQHNIRVNTLSPTNVATRMFLNDTNKSLFVPHLQNPTDEEYEAACRPMHVLPVGWIDPSDTSSAVRWLASDEARYVTGLELRVDAGVVIR